MMAHPEVLQRGVALSKTWGLVFVFVGRFFGPLRAAVPIVAGILRMPRLKFQLAPSGGSSLDRRRIPVACGGLDQPLDLDRGQVLAGAILGVAHSKSVNHPNRFETGVPEHEYDH
jgi:hypothetical protein